MERYAPTLKDLAPRDLSALDGPGNQGRPWLRSQQGLRAAGHDPPGRRDHHEASAVRCSRSATTSPTSTSPRNRSPWCRPSTTRWAVSPTNINGQVVVPKNGNPNDIINGLYAVGECSACRCTAPTVWAPTRCSTWWCSAAPPATTSSSSTSKPRAQAAAEGRRRPDPGPPGAPGVGHRRRIRPGRRQRHPLDHAEARRRVPHPGQHGRRRQKIAEVVERVKPNIGLKDQSKVFNTARIEALEVENLIEAAKATMISAAARPGKPWRPRPRRLPRTPRDDANWMKHTAVVLQRRQPPGLQSR